MSKSLIVTVIFLVNFVAGLATVNYFNHFYAQKALENDAEALLYQFHDTLIEAHKVLDFLPEPDEFQCNEITVEKLAKLAYENPSVRLIGLFHGNEQTCASEPVHLDLSDYHELIIQEHNYKIADDLALATIGNDDGGLDFLMVRSHNNSRYFASINPFKIDYLTEYACINCLEYDFLIDGQPELAFRSRRINSPAFVEYISSRYEDDVKVDLFLRGTKEFFNYYKELSWVSTVVFAFFFAGVIAFLSYKLLSIRQSFERIIRDAIKFSEFVPFYQPIMDSRSREVIGAEVLVRWQKKDGSIVPPNQFVPFAEDSGLIIDITEQLIKKVAKDVKSLGWDKSKQFASLNIVPDHLSSDRLFRLISDQLQRHQLPAECLSLEITERMRIKDLTEARSVLEEFYRAGIKLKLDDAGTGYGIFSYVHELGASTLKIDKMFVDTINIDDVKGTVLDAIIAFAKSSNLEMIAEGVENSYQVDYLSSQGVFYIQGYIYAKPMSLEDLSEWLVAI